MKKTLGICKCLLFLSLILQLNVCIGQSADRLIPLLQKNADSTIIIGCEGVWLSSAEYKVLSKKADTISIYHYKWEYKEEELLPKKIRDTLFKMKSYQQSFMEASINRFFNPEAISVKDAKQFWSKISALEPWKIADDSIDGNGCPNAGDIHDARGIALYLVTNDKIRKLYFYAPQYYEEICPGRKGRKSILEMEKVFLSYFKEN